MTKNQNNVLVAILRSFIETFKHGINEYELIKKLQNEPFNLFDANALTDPLTLFQTHFILFNALYQLQHQWREEGFGELNIDVTCISLTPLRTSGVGIGAHDALAAYYLSWSNFANTNADDVEHLIEGFWARMAGTNTVNESEISNAKDVLNITDDELLTKPLIKQKFRRLQHQYHPDKGGDAEISKQVMWAYQLLLATIVK